MTLRVKRLHKSEWQLTVIADEDEFSYTFGTFHGMFLFIRDLVNSGDYT